MWRIFKVRVSTLIATLLSVSAYAADIDPKYQAPPYNDYVMLVVLNNLGLTHALYDEDIEAAKNLVFINLQTHLQLLRELEAENDDPEWRVRKIRILNGLALKWEKEQTSFDNKLTGDVKDEWEALVEDNWIYLKQAVEECAAHPEYECIEVAK